MGHLHFLSCHYMTAYHYEASLKGKDKDEPFYPILSCKHCADSIKFANMVMRMNEFNSHNGRHINEGCSQRL